MACFFMWVIYRCWLNNKYCFLFTLSSSPLEKRKEKIGFEGWGLRDGKVTLTLIFNRQAIYKSLEQLTLLGALGGDGELSNPLGHQMAHLPLNPIYSKALIVASQSNCLEEMLITVSMLSVESIFYRPREKLEEVSPRDIFPFCCRFC